MLMIFTYKSPLPLPPLLPPSHPFAINFDQHLCDHLNLWNVFVPADHFSCACRFVVVAQAQRKISAEMKFRPSRTAQGLMHLICFLMAEFHYARARMESSNVRAKVGRKTIRQWPQNVKLEWTRTGIPRISVIDLTVQCFVSLRRTGRALGGSSFIASHSSARIISSFSLRQRDRGGWVGGKIAFKVLTFH